MKGKQVLELGARNGGLSLYYALKGANVLCTDVKGNGLYSKAVKLHKEYNVSQNVEYETIDATDIPEKYNGFFDVITFKSVIGGVGSLGGGYEKQQAMVDSIERCLKPGGLVIFADNMQATKVHGFCRMKFRKHGMRWHYETEKEIEELFAGFKLLDKCYYGFLGCFGVNEFMRNVLGNIDTIVFERICPDRWKYIGVYIFQKQKITK